MNKDEKIALVSLPITLLLSYGLASAGSYGTHEAYGQSIFKWCFLLAFVIQWVVFIPSYIKQTESFYDLTGSITFLSTLFLAFFMVPSLNIRSMILIGIISIWTIRLGSFLFMRIQKAGHDRRFAELKPSIPRFLLAWTLQGMWVSVSLAPALAVITSKKVVALDSFAIIGLLVWLFGFTFEVISDRQKSNFRKFEQNQGKFINTGLWSWSRHPNYFGEIVLWIGVTIIALPVLSSWQFVTLISPVFITVLLSFISGVPMLEEYADKKWGGQDDYESYKRKTSVLIPFPPKSS